VAPAYHHAIIRYSRAHWDLLKKLRVKAVKVMRLLVLHGFNCILYGSVARGDVSIASDIDIAIPYLINPLELEVLLETFGIIAREIIMATPKTAIKGIITLKSNVIIEFPLSKFSKVEEEFFKFAGCMSLNEAEDYKKRVCGVDKRLCFIKPTDFGHEEWSIIGREHEVARLLNISIATVRDRVEALTKRDKVGRTGIFWRRLLNPDEDWFKVLEEESARNPAIRRLLQS